MNFYDPAFPQSQPPTETPMASVPMAEMFALWAVRLWVRAYRGGGNLLPDLRHGFVLVGMPHAWLELDEFMTRLLGCAKRPLDIRTTGSALVSVDEDGVLCWLAGLQRGDLPAGECAHLRAIATPGKKLATSFAASRLHFRFAGESAGSGEKPVIN